MTKDEALKLALEALKSCSATPHWPALQTTIKSLEKALAKQEQREPDYKTLAIQLQQQRTWVGLMRGVRVEGDTVVISTKDNNVARDLCGALIQEKNT
jgi:hypothetical protein